MDKVSQIKIWDTYKLLWVFRFPIQWIRPQRRSRLWKLIVSLLYLTHDPNFNTITLRSYFIWVIYTIVVLLIANNFSVTEPPLLFSNQSLGIISVIFLYTIDIWWFPLIWSYLSISGMFIYTSQHEISLYAS